MKLAVAMTLLAVSVPAFAQQQRITFGGTIDQPLAIIDGDEGPEGGGNPINGLIKVGDRFSLTLSFDLNDARRAFEGLPLATRSAWNIPATFSYEIGSYRAPAVDTSLHYTIYNDFVSTTGGTPYDRNAYQINDQLHPMLIFPTLGLSGVDFSFSATDLTGRSYASATLQGPIQPNNVGRSSAFLTFYSVDTADFAYTLSRDLTIAIAVPEPTTWAMMIVGVGLVGGAARRRKTTFAQA